MSYAVLITGQTDEPTTLKQFILANHNGKNFAWSRLTNGGRGESNQWNSDSYSELVVFAHGDTSLTVGAVLSTPLTEVDVQAIVTNEKPNVLIQKLTKQFSLRDKSVNTQTVGEVIKEVDNLIQQNPALLAQYRSDGRSDKSATVTQSTPTVVTPIAPTLVIERQDNHTRNLSFVPSLSDPEISGYVERTLFGEKETKLYDNALANDFNIAIVGDAGTGKTTSTMAYAAKRGLNYYRINFNAGVESSQLFGKVLPDEAGKLFWQDGGFTECWRSGNSVICLDELTFIIAKQSGILFPTLDSTKTLTLLDHKGEVIPKGKNVLIVGCYNDSYHGNNALNQAFIDRFNHKWVFEYDIEIEKQFIKSPTLLQLAQQMRADAINGLYETPISTRLLKNFQKFAQEISYEYAVGNFLNSFKQDERPSVKLLLEAHRHNLEQELTK